MTEVVAKDHAVTFEKNHTSFTAYTYLARTFSGQVFKAENNHLIEIVSLLEYTYLQCMEKKCMF